MSNRIDFFQSDQTQLAIPAATVSVWLDGSLCPYLEVIEIVRGGWPEFSWARLRYNSAAYSQFAPVGAEEVETLIPIGKNICVQQIYSGPTPGTSVLNQPVFFGKIESIETKLHSNCERVVFCHL